MLSENNADQGGLLLKCCGVRFGFLHVQTIVLTITQLGAVRSRAKPSMTFQCPLSRVPTYPAPVNNVVLALRRSLRMPFDTTPGRGWCHASR